MSDDLLAEAIARAVDDRIEASAADMGIGTVTAVNPGGVAGTVSVSVGGAATPIPMRRNAAYTPTVGDKVRWSKSRAGDWFADYKLA